MPPRQDQHVEGPNQAIRSTMRLVISNPLPAHRPPRLTQPGLPVLSPSSVDHLKHHLDTALSLLSALPIHAPQTLYVPASSLPPTALLSLYSVSHSPFFALPSLPFQAASRQLHPPVPTFAQATSSTPNKLLTFRVSNMPAERRSLRSNKSDTSANGEKHRSNSTSQNSKDKRAPPSTRSSVRGKTAAASGKKTSSSNTASSTSTPTSTSASTSAAKKMVAENDQTAPHTNGGSDPVENGVNNVNGTEDVEMAEDDADINGSATQKNQREGGGESDDGMTVVVPPSKGSRLSGEPEQHQHDITMNEAEGGDEAEVEVQVDPREKALSDIKSNFTLLERAVIHFDPRFTLRALRSISSFFERTRTSRQPITTLLLRNYLSTSHISQADLFVSRSEFPPGAPNNQIARYLYYLGRIRAIQLQYTEAHEHLIGATRKSPSSHTAGGFYQASTKLLVVVELLMGDIPDRAIFRQATLERAMHPYFLLVQAVSIGDLDGFIGIVQKHSSTFRRDGTYTLILRLRQNVIKTGIRMMSLAYTRISLRDICLRLGLDSEESAEYIVAKAIRDGVIEASLDHEHGYMKSKEVGDVYATGEPGEVFHERIRFCLDLHDESVKAMRFPMNQHRLELKNAQEARERERELAKEIVEGDLDDDDAGGDFDTI
ncbi:26S proteasome non-ATPase regulatory subunit 3 [Histoplasma capsulatum H143]|uniref:26S proteasome non-ATPase regulatory subunit 3 n=1 Tax=Ajellomyces capsulatus (strain H143) TaxID=544712 RepID=C6HQL1_AJECH|nr:26S proteasome non-ATPase regulatory subunit 3 [Histoplasma capsulatum H143]